MDIPQPLSQTLQTRGWAALSSLALPCTVQPFWLPTPFVSLPSWLWHLVPSLPSPFSCPSSHVAQLSQGHVHCELLQMSLSLPMLSLSTTINFPTTTPTHLGVVGHALSFSFFLFSFRGKMGGVERGEAVARRYDMREESLFNKEKKINSTDVKWGRKRSQRQIVPSSTETKRNINYVVLRCSRFYCARMGRESHIGFLGMSGYCSGPHGRIRHTAREQVHKVVMETRPSLCSTHLQRIFKAVLFSKINSICLALCQRALMQPVF